MFGFGVAELLVILVIILIVFGAGKLPGIGEGLGRGIRSFRKSVQAPPDEIDVSPKPGNDELSSPAASSGSANEQGRNQDRQT